MILMVSERKVVDEHSAAPPGAKWTRNQFRCLLCRRRRIAELPMPIDMDADYSPQSAKLARLLRIKINSDELSHPMPLPATVASQYYVSAMVCLRCPRNARRQPVYVARPDKYPVLPDHLGRCLSARPT